MPATAAAEPDDYAPNCFRATLEGHDEAAHVSWLRWCGRRLRVPMACGLPLGAEVAWTIPSDQVRLMSNSGRPARIDDTPFVARLVDVTAQNGIVRVMAQVADAPDALVLMTADAQIAWEHGVAEGAELTLRLRGDSIRVTLVANG